MSAEPHDPSDWQRPASARLVDPEDDLHSSTYGGDFETTAIPRFDTGQPVKPEQQGFALLGEPEPLPYVSPGIHQPLAAVPVEPTAIYPDDTAGRRNHAGGKRGTTDLGLLLLRVGLGALLIVHGLQKAFGWWGGIGLGGFQDSLAGMGYEHSGLLTYLAAGAQIGAGVLLVLGLFTPLAAAVALAYLINALLAGVTAQTGHGFVDFFGREFQITLVVLAAALTLTGPGRYGFDAGRGWARRPFIGSFLALVLGIGAGVAVWVLLNGTNPIA